MSKQNEVNNRTVSGDPSILRLYRASGLLMAVVFASVGFIFLFAPSVVIEFFNGISIHFGMSELPAGDGGFYTVLAVAYMYVVTYLAFVMYRFPENRQALLILINAKSASSVLSLLSFVFKRPYLIFVVNAVVDGTIALMLIFLSKKMKAVHE